MAITGYGTTLSGSETGTITRIQSISWSGADSEIIVLKTLADVNRWVSKIAGSRDAGELTVNCLYDKNQYSTLIGKVGDDAETWTGTLPDGTKIISYGFVKNVGGLEINTDGAIVYNFTIPLSGEPAVTPG